MTLQSHSPIGVFDSGVGGLTVLKALREKLPNESTVYLGDTARVPYGTKSGDVVQRYSLMAARFLAQHEVKLLVVACNTASAVALPALQAALAIPVIGVIEPGARAAAAKTRSGKVGVIGTPGTIHSGAYVRALEAARPGVTVRSKGCPLFVPLAEEGWTHGQVPTLVAQTYLGELKSSGIDTLVLGCTHYPVLRDVIAEVMGPSVALVDSAEATSAAVAAGLSQSRVENPGGTTPTHRFFVTDVPARFIEVGARFLGASVEHVEQVDLLP
jgi:glutamate racemase